MSNGTGWGLKTPVEGGSDVQTRVTGFLVTLLGAGPGFSLPGKEPCWPAQVIAG